MSPTDRTRPTPPRRHHPSLRREINRFKGPDSAIGTVCACVQCFVYTFLLKGCLYLPRGSIFYLTTDDFWTKASKFVYVSGQ